MPKTFVFLLIFLIAAPALNAQKTPPEEKPLVVRFSQPGGFYRQPLSVALEGGGATIYYTTDGTYPTTRSIRYTGPFTVANTAVIRAMARRGNISGRPFAKTYFINEPPTDLPVISVSIAPGLLFNPETGIMMDGLGADSAFVHKPGANFWTRREFSCNVEIFEADKTCVFNSGAGMRLFGGYSRIYGAYWYGGSCY